MYIGIDLGTSGVKVVLLNDEQHIVPRHNNHFLSPVRNRCGRNKIRKTGGMQPIKRCLNLPLNRIYRV